MEKVLCDFRTYLNSILRQHTIDTSGADRVGGTGQLKRLTDFTHDYNNRAIEKALEILGNPNIEVDKKVLKDELANVIKEYSKKFLDENFKMN